MTGILAINAFLHSEKYTQQDKLLLAGAKACGINLKSTPIWSCAWLCPKQTLYCLGQGCVIGPRLGTAGTAGV